MINRIVRLAAPVALAVTAACADTTSVLAPPVETPRAVGVVVCTVRPAAGTVRCGDPAPRAGISADLIVGGQGTHVQLRSGNVQYDSVAEVLSADVTLQNLLGQPVGTEDGTTVEGVRIFFHLKPVVTLGGGTAKLRNPDGLETFTAGTQPFFYYDEILAPYERTAARRWEWTVSKTVTEFTFQVYVSAKVPNQAGVLRWTRERGDVVSRDLFAVWGTGPNDIWAGGDRTMMYNNGTRWVVIPGDWDGGVTAIHGSATDDVWAVGAQLLRRFDGRRWSTVTPPVNENFSGVWASAPNNVYVTGGAFGWVLRWDGEAWNTVFTATQGRRFTGVWGSGANDVHVLGSRYNPGTQTDDAYVWHWNGAQWDSTAFAGTYLSAIWGSSANDVYAVGLGGTIVHFDGTAWSTVGAGVTSYGLRRVWGSGPNDVWAVGGGYHAGGPEATVLHYDGTQWSEVQTGGLKTAAAVFAPNPDKVYVLGYGGMIQKRSGGQWQAETSVNGELLQAVWPVGDDDALAAACGGVMRTQGQGWAMVHATPDDCLTDVWATPGGAQIFAVGTPITGRYPVIVRWDGTAWSRTEVTDARELTAVWGFSANDVYAVGYTDGSQRPVIRHWDGTAWTDMPTGLPYGQIRGIWGSSPNNLYAVGTHVLRWNGTWWETLSVHYSSDMYEDVWGSGPDDVYVSGGGIYHWDGGSWSALFPRLNYRGWGVWGSGPNDVYVVGTQSLHFNGTSWTEVNIETSSTLFAVRGSSARSVWAVGAGGVVMRGKR